MVLDHETCNVAGCAIHTGWVKTTTYGVRNAQIRDDWLSGAWTLEELSSFWGLKPLSIKSIVRGAEKTGAGHPPLEVANRR
jgi:hypothetical protein